MTGKTALQWGKWSVRLGVSLGLILLFGLVPGKGEVRSQDSAKGVLGGAGGFERSYPGGAYRLGDGCCLLARREAPGEQQPGWVHPTVGRGRASSSGH